MDTTHTSEPFELHAPDSFFQSGGNWIITSAKSPDPVTKARYVIVGKVPAHVEGNPLWETPTDEELRTIARMFKAAPALLAALDECVTDEGANCYRLRDPEEMVKALRRRLEVISCIARAAIAQAEKD